MVGRKENPGYKAYHLLTCGKRSILEAESCVCVQEIFYVKISLQLCILKIVSELYVIKYNMIQLIIHSTIASRLFVS